MIETESKYRADWSLLLGENTFNDSDREGWSLLLGEQTPIIECPYVVI